MGNISAFLLDGRCWAHLKFGAVHAVVGPSLSVAALRLHAEFIVTLSIHDEFAPWIETLLFYLLQQLPLFFLSVVSPRPRAFWRRAAWLLDSLRIML